MKKRYLLLAAFLCVGSWCVLSGSNTVPMALSADAPKQLMFEPVRIDAPVHDPAKWTFWFGPYSECGAVLDINGDGKLDISAGKNYFIAPNWTKYADFRDGAETNGPDVDNNYEDSMDVNNDGKPDILSSGWMRKTGLYWYENPGKLGVRWTAHEMINAAGVEAFAIGNLSGASGAGRDVLLNYFAARPDRPLVWWEHINQAPWFKQHDFTPPNVGVSHGNGIGDMNGDGRNDVVTTTGWFESPPRPTQDQWIFHPDYTFLTEAGRKSGAGQPVLVTDANGDGLNDIIWGSDHQYGLYWMEQRIVGDKRTFIQHTIESEFPSFHTMALGDLDGDGRPELVTGKEVFAHNGGDPGGFEPNFVFYYKFQNGQFERHIVSYSYATPYFGPGPEAKGPPPTNAYIVGVGMAMKLADMDGDRRLDIVIPCKTGLYIFFNRGLSAKGRGTNYLPVRENYPGNTEFNQTVRPGAGAQGTPAQPSPR